MLDSIGGITSDLVHLALDAAMLRHRVIANNIANASTPGYAKKSVSFEKQLAGYVADSGKIDAKRLMNEMPELIRQLESGEVVKVDINEQVELDQQMVELTKNVIRYQALLEALQKRGDILRMAVSEGRS